MGAGSVGSFEEFYVQHFGPVRDFAAHRFGAANADDIAQETMLRAFAHFEDLTDDRPAMPWLRTVALRIGIDGQRRQHSESMDHEDLVALSPSVPDESVEVAMRVDVGGLLHRAMRKLTVRDRQALTLREIHGLGVGEIAALTGSNPNSVRQRLFRARNNLSRYYREIGGGAYSAPPVGTPGRKRLAWRAAVRVAELRLPAPAGRALGGAATAVVAAVIGTTLTSPSVPRATPPQVEAAPGDSELPGLGGIVGDTARDVVATTVRTVAAATRRPLPPLGMLLSRSYDESFDHGLSPWQVAGAAASTACDGGVMTSCHLVLDPHGEVAVTRRATVGLAKSSLLVVGLHTGEDSHSEVEVSLGAGSVTVTTAVSSGTGTLTVRSSRSTGTARTPWVPENKAEMWLRLDRATASVTVGQAGPRGPMGEVSLATGFAFTTLHAVTLRARRTKPLDEAVRVDHVYLVRSAACYNGIDDDGDGPRDIADDGCSNIFDKDEDPPACSDGVDNDGDGLVDFPDDRSCAWQGDETEETECSNGRDDDRDGAADYPEDTECFGEWDEGELFDCVDGWDSDHDGVADLGDLGCAGPDDPSELACLLAAVDRRGLPAPPEAEQDLTHWKRTGVCLDPRRVLGTYEVVSVAPAHAVRAWLDEYRFNGVPVHCVTWHDGPSRTSPCETAGGTFVRHLGALVQGDLEGLPGDPGSVRACSATLLLHFYETNASLDDRRDAEHVVTLC